MPTVFTVKLGIDEELAKEVAKCMKVKLPTSSAFSLSPRLAEGFGGMILALAHLAAKTINAGRAKQSKRASAKKARTAGRKGQ